MNKKIISVILTLLIVISVVSPAVFADDNEVLPISELTANEQVQEFIPKYKNLFDAIGITFEPQNSGSVTRAEAALAVSGMLGYNEVESTVQIFDDVSPEDPAFYAINTLTGIGLFSAEEKLFYPNEPVTMDQALKILTSAIGYGPAAVQKGGWPVGYKICAVEAGITKGVDLSGDVTASKFEKLVYNTLNADIMVVSSVDKYITSSVSDECILNKIHNVYSDEGIVNATDVSSLLGHTSVKKFVTIGDISLKTEEPYRELLGYNVQYFYKTQDGESILLFAEESRNNVTKVNNEDVLGYTNHKFRYRDENDDECEEFVRFNTDTLKNGKSVSGDLSVFSPANGYVELIDNNDDGDIDVVKCWDFVSVVVSSVETTKKWIYDKISTGTKYDFKSRQYDFVSSETGQKIAFESIKPNMIISMAENGNYTYALVTNTVIRGEISGRSKDGTKVYAIIDGITYEISNAVNSSENLYIGNEVEMYLDFKDTIVYCASNEFKGRKLAYMISHGTTRSNLDPRAQIKILDQSGKITILDFANKVSFNNQTGIKDQILIDSALNNVSNIFMYTLNDEGKINKVYYPKDGEDSGIYNYFNNATGSLQYSNTNKTLGKSIFVDQNATIFKIPSSSFVGATEEDYTIATRDSLRDSLSYTVLASYTSKEDSIASDIILMKYNVASIGYNYLPVMLITKKANAIDEEGEQVDVLYGVSSKGEEVKYIGQNGKFSGCNVGDIVKLESAGGIVKMAPIVGYDAENDVVNGFNSQSNSIQKGVILQRENALIKFYLGNTPSSPALSDIKLYDLDGAKISLYDKAAKRATDTTLEELKDYESFADSTQEVIILANDKEKAYWVIIFE